MRPVVELVVAWAEAGGSPVVVEGDRVVTGLGESLRQLDVERIEPPDVRDDHHSGLTGLGSLDERRREGRSIV
jgi:hypothetical protein